MTQEKTTIAVGWRVWALGVMALAAVGLAWGDFDPGQPVPKSFPERTILAYAACAFMLVAGAAVEWRRTTAWAATGHAHRARCRGHHFCRRRCGCRCQADAEDATRHQAHRSHGDPETRAMAWREGDRIESPEPPMHAAPVVGAREANQRPRASAMVAPRCAVLGVTRSGTGLPSNQKTVEK